MIQWTHNKTGGGPVDASVVPQEGKNSPVDAIRLLVVNLGDTMVSWMWG